MCSKQVSAVHSCVVCRAVEWRGRRGVAGVLGGPARRVRAVHERVRARVAPRRRPAAQAAGAALGRRTPGARRVRISSQVTGAALFRLAIPWADCACTTCAIKMLTQNITPRQCFWTGPVAVAVAVAVATATPATWLLQLLVGEYTRRGVSLVVMCVATICSNKKFCT